MYSLAALPLPAVAAATLLVQAVAWVNRNRGDQEVVRQPSTCSGDEDDERGHRTVLMVDGLTILVLRLTRLVCVLGLVVLAALEVVRGDTNQTIIVGLLASYVSSAFTSRWPTSLMNTFHTDKTYVTILSSASIIVTSTYWRRNTSRDASLCLFAGFIVYFLQDAWPYAILYPPQSHEVNWLSWTKFALLAFTGAFIPLIMPGSENDDPTKVRVRQTIPISHVLIDVPVDN